MKIKELPKSQRPREKAMRFGVESLSDQELLALIIGSGVKGKSALEISSSILSIYKSLSNLANINFYALKNEYGLSVANSLKLQAVFECHKRLNSSHYKDEIIIKDSNKIYTMYKYLEDLEQEIFIIVMLNQSGKIIKEKVMYKGMSTLLELNLKEIMSEILQTSAKKFYIIHNHPDGQMLPSKEDENATEIIQESADMFGIKLIDHIIIFKNGYYSFMNKSNSLRC